MGNLPLEYQGLIGALIIFAFNFAIINWLIKKFFPKPLKRPSAITTVCLFIFFGSIASIIYFPSNIQNLLSVQALLLFLNGILSLLIVVGLWKMKKIAAIGYAAITVFNQFVSIIQGGWSVFQIIPIIVVAIIFIYFSEMR